MQRTLERFKLYWIQNVRIMMIIAVIDAVTSQIYLTHFYNGFRISVSVLILPVFYYFYKNIHPILMAIWLGAFGLLFRGIIGASLFGGFSQAVAADWQIFFFDISYGLLFYSLFYISKEKALPRWAVVVWFCDFSSNFIEMTTRFGIVYSTQVSILNSLFTVALIRTIIATGLVFLLRYYKIIMLKEQKMEKYKAMYAVMADLKSEVYYMQENMDHIEDVMSDAYHLYEHLSLSEDEDSRQTSLRIAKDVHEIKKNYIKVVDGIARIGVDQNINVSLELKDIIELLIEYFKNDFEKHQIQFRVENKIQNLIFVKDHFLFMSALRNLIANSIEAINAHSSETKSIKISLKENHDDIWITVTDSGPGIKSKELDFVFNPGYSTKFNPQTGDIYRGLGLTLVKDITESNFEGTIFIETEIGVGTSFRLSIPKEKLEVNHEILYTR